MRGKEEKLRLVARVFVAFLLLGQVEALAVGLPRALQGDGDFPAFYSAALMVRARDGTRLYDVSTQDRFEKRVFPDREVAPQYFYHPPFEALALLPLSFLSYRAAFWVWTLAGLAVFFLAAVLLSPHLGRLRAGTGVPVPLLFLAFFPAAVTVLLGQDSFFLFVLIVLAFHEFQRHRDVQCGIFLGLACFKFQHIAPLVLLLALLRWRPKLVAGFAATAGSLLGVSWALCGLSGLVQYWHLLWHHLPEHGWTMPNLRGLVNVIGWRPEAIVAGSVVIVLWCGLRKPGTRMAEFAVAVVAAELVSYHLHLYDTTVLLLPLTLTLDQVMAKGSLWRLLLPGLFFVTFLYSFLLLHRLVFLLALPMLFLLLVIPRWFHGSARAVVESAGIS